MTRDWPSVVQVVLQLDERLGRAPAGWKIGAASEEIRRAEGLPGPSPGRIYLDTVFRSPAVLPGALFINFRNVECEFAFRLGDGIPAARRAVHRGGGRREHRVPDADARDRRHGLRGLVRRERLLRLVPRQRRWRRTRLRARDRRLARARPAEHAARALPERHVRQGGVRPGRDGAPADVAHLARQLARRARPRDRRRRDRQHRYLHRSLLLRAGRQVSVDFGRDRRPDARFE